jgi:hypothetical protein
MAIRQLGKPAGTWCVHIAGEKGCSVYETRPPACRDFACGWLMQPSIPDGLRPDRSKVILQLESAKRLVARCDPGDPLAWRKEPMYATLKDWAAKAWPAGHQVLAAAGDRYWAITPDRAQPDMDLGLLTPQRPFEIDLMSDGRLMARIPGSPS